MESSSPLTVEEAAQLLKVSKYTIYELIKRGEIPAQRIGRQIRIDPDTLFNSLHRSDQNNNPTTKTFEPENPDLNQVPPTDQNSNSINPTSNFKSETPLNNLVFIGSHDPVVELFADFWKHASTPFELHLEFKGSMEGLMALYHNQAQISGIHLWDENTQEYNLPYIHYVIPGEPVTLINLVQRIQGFIIQPGNPWKLKSWEDLTQKGLRFVNRQKGSGTRLKLDSYLNKAKITPAEIQGYTQEVDTHMDIASCVANNQADVGIGVQSAAHRMGLDFIPLFHERYDLVLLPEKMPTEALQHILTILKSPAFHNAIERQVGYDTSLTGKILYQN
ncbi:substrate-binding domain-containing protein [Desulfitobacterium metallireducens]|uniref:Molybdate-binding protein n=1 Tax=Desulfitobacterium metallireducens DSM 15288 TaxID=871968 RepID=W0E8K1_9FIRM|nr:helix-turn-helix transcriptional regulator [Desulfitobacterium metallireducens]AHF05848.1 molybdate-binding protein [Desulfitobacterium metallireducens DSM 15288]